MFKAIRSAIFASALVAALPVAPATSADLSEDLSRPLATAQSPWTFTFTAYGWLPWLSGSTTIRGRTFDVQADPTDILENLNWSTLPAWMSYAEARRGRVSFFNDIVYANISGSRGFSKVLPGSGQTLTGGISADYEQATVEFGGAYEVWSGRHPALPGSAALDLVAGGRYWHQDVSISGFLQIDPLTRETERSGSIDWVDPFVGARLRQQLSRGDALMVRGDVGGFGAGSEFSWQVIATYNWQMCTMGGHPIDGYLGYRALSVDYSQGSGAKRYEYDVLQQGPVMGATMSF